MARHATPRDHHLPHGSVQSTLATLTMRRYSQRRAVPAVSVIVPTYNEEGTIAELLESLSALTPGEVIVADGNSADGTRKIAARYARVLCVPRCRAAQMNAGARIASGEVLLFLHADVQLGPGALLALGEHMRDPALVGGNFDVRYLGNDLPAQAFTLLNRWRRRWGIFYGDSGIFCRRPIFEALGGFRPWPILEDYDFARRLGSAGKLALLDEPIWVSDRRWRNAGLLPTLWSWFWVQALYLAGVSPSRLASLYPPVRRSNASVSAQLERPSEQQL
jgi:rSAM/selenodomain-associated transferase 2